MPIRTITKVEKQAKRDRYNIYLDGVYAFSLSCRLADRCKVEENQTITEKELRDLKEKDQEVKAYNRAILILSYRANTTCELRRKLLKNFDKPIIERVIVRLQKQGLLDDIELAQRYVEQSKKGKGLVKLELMKKGIPKEVAKNAIEIKDNEAELENARKLAQKILKKYAEKDTGARKKKVYEGLTRRGFSYDVFRVIWDEAK